MSRAACSASVASVACKEPTCLCASPLRLRIKTSQSGMFGVAIFGFSLLCGLQGGTLLPLLGIGQRGLAHPSAIVVCLAPRRETIAVAGTVAGQHLLELLPVDRAVFPVAAGVLFHAGIGNR